MCQIFSIIRIILSLPQILIVLTDLYNMMQYFMDLEMVLLNDDDILFIFAPNIDCRCSLEPPF